MSRARVQFLAWAPTAGRARDLAADLDGEAVTIYPKRLTARKATPLRYAVSSLVTVGRLARSRPRAVVVQNPPVYPGVIALAYARLARARFVLDSHPASFGAKDNAQAQKMLRITARLARKADGVLVTTESWAQVVRSWGGRPLVLHEAPPHWTTSPARPLDGRRPQVLFSCVFASDEPVAEVVAAARSLPELDVLVTGDPRRAPAGILDDLPANVRLTGWLDQAAYAAEVDGCDILLALTTEPTSVMRAAYEAGYARRVLVMSDTRTMRELFPEAVTCGDDRDSIAAGLALAVRDHDRLVRDLDTVRARQQRRWDTQRQELLEMLALPDPSGSTDLHDDPASDAEPATEARLP
ncbi:glycosyltransferase [Longivirga aurantiaca]|uniref:Glycosyltransferase n=1 Tax=Longivirga aurantiaca TaxID=1837743 RepID=A0ABW1T3Y8_9ACTN